jgi:hypothetical protein
MLSTGSDGGGGETKNESTQHFTNQTFNPRVIQLVKKALPTSCPGPEGDVTTPTILQLNINCMMEFSRQIHLVLVVIHSFPPSS